MILRHFVLLLQTSTQTTTRATLSFRKRFLKEIEALMVQVLLIAHMLGALNLGNIALDGSKIKANASRHSALSYEHIKQLEQQLKDEVQQLMARAKASRKVRVERRTLHLTSPMPNVR
jgi:hypothetical protein